jgi:hypothetical protein
MKCGTAIAVRQAVALLALVSAQGCALITGSDCAGMSHYGVLATVLDARSQLPPASAVKLTLREGEYVEVLTASVYGGSTYGGASDRQGRYSLAVEAAGYETFVKNDLEVTGGSCGKVNTNNVTVQLTRST